jgi:hypothetical protein
MGAVAGRAAAGETTGGIAESLTDAGEMDGAIETYSYVIDKTPPSSQEPSR